MMWEGERGTEESSVKREKERDVERRKRRREQRRSDWRRNANPNYERSLAPVGCQGRAPVDRSLFPYLTFTRSYFCPCPVPWCTVYLVAEPGSPTRGSRNDRRGREEEPLHRLSLRVAALQHSRLPRPFGGAGTLCSSVYTHTRSFSYT